MITISYIWESIKNLIRFDGIAVESELTDWYDADIKPVRVGVYQVESDMGNFPIFAYYNGQEWCDKDNRELIYFKQDRTWRGLAHEPK